MSKIKLLINEVFKRAELDSGIKKKYPLALYLKVHLEAFKIFFDEKTFVRYYEGKTEPDPETLNKLSKYLGYKDFNEFSNTFIKTNEEANFTKINVSVDGNAISNPNEESRINVIIKIINKLDFPGKDLLMKNGLGILEMTFLLFLVTGGVVFSNNKNPKSLGFMSAWGTPAIEKPFMYWDKDRYIATDSSYLGPQINVIPMNQNTFIYQKKIMRKDTMTVNNSLGKVWCSKFNNNVDFFMMDGINPENGKELKLATDYMILNYAGANAELEE